MTAPAPERAPVTYDPELDNCAGGCRRNDDRRVAFGFYGLSFACPGCFEAILGGKPDADQVITLTPEQVASGRMPFEDDDGTPGACVTCTGSIRWVSCPTGGWWSHDIHPADEHDATPAQNVPGPAEQPEGRQRAISEGLNPAIAGPGAPDGGDPA